MVAIKIDCVFLIVIASILQLSKTQRRISAGHPVQTDKGYVVYLTKSSKSEKYYDFWICGGAIVSKVHIITSAACVEDVEFMYAVAGYKKYVPNHRIDEDQCTKEMKKKLFTLVPKLYELDYARIEKWAYIDIAVVKVESEFDFNDSRYTKLCSYKPRTIQINYDPKYQEPNTDSIVFGWGHEEKWRRPEDANDYNQENLRYAPTLIHNKRECKESFTNIPQLMSVIDKYMICTLDKGNLNEEGKLIKTPTLADGCTPNMKLMANGEIACEEDEIFISDETRRSGKSDNILARILKTQQSRRQGICQNDHGGPLVTWVGAQEVLIGVASVFRVTGDSRCAGPYLYTSTQCNGIFLDCILNSSGDKTRRAICKKPPIERGFHTIEKHISWRNHPDGPAENELVMRPQRPIRPYG
ncbi:hypothetical protein evm_007083 [Chilo suppressalis]|nr:hypothetical protein evm_007083 [Chilo suppressalis]